MKKVYRNAMVWRGSAFERADVIVEQGVICAIGVSQVGDESTDLSGLYLIPGLVDVHVHLREPGFTYKETIASGTAAAAHGGYTTICPMPNLSPAPDSMEHLQIELDAIDGDAVVRVLPYATITQGQRGRGELVDFSALAESVIGFSDDGRGVQEGDLMAEAMRGAAAVGRPIVAHCEVDDLLRGGYIHDGEYARKHGHKGICSQSEWQQVARDLELAAQTGCQYHVCHVSTRQSVELVRAAKARGLKVSCETAPHYLILTDADLREEGRFKMNPPLRSTDDRAALIEGIQDGTIEVIATDHAPHSEQEKSRGLADSAMGVVGLECAFGLMYKYMVLEGKITFERLVELMSSNPRRLFGLGGGRIEVGAVADFTVVELDTQYTIDPEAFLSMGHATPFAGWPAQGRAMLTVVGGEEAYNGLENNKTNK